MSERKQFEAFLSPPPAATGRPHPRIWIFYENGNRRSQAGYLADSARAIL